MDPTGPGGGAVLRADRRVEARDDCQQFGPDPRDTVERPLALATQWEGGRVKTAALVVDDDRAIREMLETALEAEGYLV